MLRQAFAERLKEAMKARDAHDFDRAFNYCRAQRPGYRSAYAREL